LQGQGLAAGQRHAGAADVALQCILLARDRLGHIGARCSGLSLAALGRVEVRRRFGHLGFKRREGGAVAVPLVSALRARLGLRIQ